MRNIYLEKPTFEGKVWIWNQSCSYGQGTKLHFREINSQGAEQSIYWEKQELPLYQIIVKKELKEVQRK